MNRLRFLHIGVAGALLALILWKTGINDVREVLRDVDARLLVAVALLNIPLALLFPVRSHFVLRRLGADIEPRVLVPAAILGNVAGSLTPASSGELLRTTVLRTHADLAVEDGLALVLYERGVSMYLMMLGTGVAAAFVALDFGPAAATGALSLPLFALPAAAPALLRLLPDVSDDDRVGAVRSMLRRVQRVAGRLRFLFGDRRLLAGWSLLTAAMFAIAMLQLWLLARSVSHAIRPEEAWVGYGASQLAGIASLLPLGLGAADGSLAALLRRMGTTFEEGTVVAILVRATMTLPLGLMAVASWVWLARQGAPEQRAENREQRTGDGKQQTGDSKQQTANSKGHRSP